MKKPIHIHYYQRKRRNGQNFSIEQIFERLRNSLNPSEFKGVIKISKHVSSGLFNRVWNTLEAPFRQGDINHVTGDVHYVSLLLRKRKTINTYHDIGNLFRTKGLKRWLFKKIWLEWPARKSKFITVVSAATKKEIARETSIPLKKIRIIPVAIADHFKPRKETPTNERFTILQMGSAENKNLSRLIDAVSGLDVKIDIVGEPGEKNREKMKSKGVEFEAESDLNSAEVLERYKRADILFFASTYEGFGMPILEANAVGVPVITSDILSMPEVGGDAAVYVDPTDVNQIRQAIEMLKSDEQLRSTLIEAGFENVKRFSNEEITKKYSNLYLEMGKK